MAWVGHARAPTSRVGRGDVDPAAWANQTRVTLGRTPLPVRAPLFG